MTTIAIFGYPGAGKSWAVSNYLQGKMAVRKRIGLVDYHDLGEVAVMGIYDGSKFQGTDRLSMAVSTDFARFLETMKTEGKQYVIGEGDRINNLVFLRAAIALSSTIRVKCDPKDYETLRLQRAQRNHQFPQSFLKATGSKVDKHFYDTTLTSDQLLVYLNQL